jgi:hypothetical protein
MRENRTSGTEWGVLGNRHSYHNGGLNRSVLVIQGFLFYIEARIQFNKIVVGLCLDRNQMTC